MSTKIYNGYKLDGIGSIGELQDLLDVFQAKCVSIAERESKRMIVKESVSLYDEASLRMESALRKLGKDEPTFKNCIFKVVLDFQNRAFDILKTNSRDPDIDWSCEVVVLKFGMAMLYTENEAMTKAWKSLPSVKPFPYWNNTDKPDHLTDKEWSQRSKQWDMALGGDGNSTPAESGLCRKMTPVGWHWLGEIKELHPVIRVISKELYPSKRARSIAFDQLMDKRMLELGGGKVDTSNLMRVFDEANEQVRANEAEWEAKAKEVEPKLKTVRELLEELSR